MIFLEKNSRSDGVAVAAYSQKYGCWNQNLQVSTWSHGWEIHVQQILLTKEIYGFGVALGNVSKYY